MLFSDASITKESSVVSLGVTLRMVVELNSNSNVRTEIISKTKTKACNYLTNEQLRLLILIEAIHMKAGGDRFTIARVNLAASLNLQHGVWDAS